MAIESFAVFDGREGPKYSNVEIGFESPFSADGRRTVDFGPGVAQVQLNSVASDIQPNVRKDGREIDPASFRDLRVSTLLLASRLNNRKEAPAAAIAPAR